jgi:Ankyrin repeats (3 copies)
MKNLKLLLLILTITSLSAMEEPLTQEKELASLKDFVKNVPNAKETLNRPLRFEEHYVGDPEPVENVFYRIFIPIKRKWQKVLELSLKNGADPNVKNKGVHFWRLLFGEMADGKFLEGITPLQYAIRTGDSQIVKILIENGAKVDAPGAQGIVPLEAAMRENNPDIVEMLLKAGAGVSRKQLDSLYRRIKETETMKEQEMRQTPAEKNKKARIDRLVKGASVSLKSLSVDQIVKDIRNNKITLESLEGKISADLYNEVLRALL